MSRVLLSAAEGGCSFVSVSSPRDTEITDIRSNSSINVLWLWVACNYSLASCTTKVQKLELIFFSTK